MGAEYILELEHISKEFPGVKALDDVSLALKKGEVRGLVGENGAGKSTLMKILTGVYQKDAGVDPDQWQRGKNRNTAAGTADGPEYYFSGV